MEPDLEDWLLPGLMAIERSPCEGQAFSHEELCTCGAPGKAIRIERLSVVVLDRSVEFEVTGNRGHRVKCWVYPSVVEGPREFVSRVIGVLWPAVVRVRWLPLWDDASQECPS